MFDVPPTTKRSIPKVILDLACVAVVSYPRARSGRETRESERAKKNKRGRGEAGKETPLPLFFRSIRLRASRTLRKETTATQAILDQS